MTGREAHPCGMSFGSVDKAVSLAWLCAGETGQVVGCGRCLSARESASSGRPAPDHRSWPPESERHSWGARKALKVFDSRLGLVTRQLARSPYLAGAKFTAADISVTYALLLARRAGGVTLGVAEQAYAAPGLSILLLDARTLIGPLDECGQIIAADTLGIALTLIDPLMHVGHQLVRERPCRLE